jgi:phosphoserine phosphatase
MASPELVATLIAGTGAKLSDAFLQELARQSKKAGLQSLRVAWLAPDKAADIFGAGLGADAWRDLLNQALALEPIDVIVQAAAKRCKKLLVADMESTIIEQELLDELAGEIGLRDQVAAITRRAMNGEIDFVAALRERMALFKNRPVSLLEKAARGITYMPGAAALVAAMKKNGAKAWLVTGGFSFFAAPVAAKLGFDGYHANELIIENGILTGEARVPILDRNRKKALLEQACAELSLSVADSLCVGDGANDVPMLTACVEGGGLGIAYHAKPKVREAIPHQINHADLTALLYAQGLR